MNNLPLVGSLCLLSTPNFEHHCINILLFIHHQYDGVLLSFVFFANWAQNVKEIISRMSLTELQWCSSHFDLHIFDENSVNQTETIQIIIHLRRLNIFSDLLKQPKLLAMAPLLFLSTYCSNHNCKFYQHFLQLTESSLFTFSWA